VRFLEDGGIHLTLGAALFRLKRSAYDRDRSQLFAARSDDDDGSVSILDTLSLNIKRLTVHPGTLPYSYRLGSGVLM